MKLHVLGIKDSKLGLVENPFTIRHIGDALRQFETLKKDPQTKFGRNPEDFSLWQIANYDDETFVFENLKVPMQLSEN